MRVRLESIIVDDQAKALKFYTEKLGFKVKTDIPAGGARWITLVPPDEADGPELLLEPIGMDFAKTFQQTLYERGIPLTMLASDDVQKEYETLKANGVAFKMPPQVSPGGGPLMAIFDDTCGNYIVMYERPDRK
jgi:catechol 2,3-dioxygenase-like lactoylglutathione lyase family enzyme